MRTNKKNRMGNRGKDRVDCRDRKKASGRRKTSFLPGKEQFGDDPACEEILAAFLSDLFGDGGGSGNMTPMFGVIELDPETGINLKLQNPDYMNHVDGKMKNIMSEAAGSGKKDPGIPKFEGCGEEVFLAMLADLNAMMKIILESDHMMRMVCEADVAQDDARCVTYLGVREGRDILKKWNQYRDCDT